MRQASIAYGCNVDTLMRHYVPLDEQAVTRDVFARMHGAKTPTGRRNRIRCIYCLLLGDYLLLR